MDTVGFARLGSLMGVGGGTIRYILLRIRPAFWLRQPAYLFS
jgi:uncharacterized membrane protein YeiH